MLWPSNIRMMEGDIDAISVWESDFNHRRILLGSGVRRQSCLPMRAIRFGRARAIVKRALRNGRAAGKSARFKWMCVMRIPLAAQ